MCREIRQLTDCAKYQEMAEIERLWIPPLCLRSLSILCFYIKTSDLSSISFDIARRTFVPPKSCHGGELWQAPGGTPGTEDDV